jgi:hypothetical protein
MAAANDGSSLWMSSPCSKRIRDFPKPVNKELEQFLLVRKKVLSFQRLSSAGPLPAAGLTLAATSALVSMHVSTTVDNVRSALELLDARGSSGTSALAIALFRLWKGRPCRDCPTTNRAESPGVAGWGPDPLDGMVEDALGPVDNLPQRLRTPVTLCLSSTFPILVAWGARTSRSTTMPTARSAATCVHAR